MQKTKLGDRGCPRRDLLSRPSRPTRRSRTGRSPATPACSATTASAASRRPTRSRPSRAASTSATRRASMSATGTRTSTARFYNGANLEMDFYGGYKGRSATFTLDVGALYYYYPGSGAGGTFKIDNTELYVGGGYGPFSAEVLATRSATSSASPTRRTPATSTATAHYDARQRLRADRPRRLPEQLKDNARVTEIDGTRSHDSITD